MVGAHPATKPARTRRADRSCSCGAGLWVDGPTRQLMLDGFDRDHTGPGHRPVNRPASKEGRR